MKNILETGRAIITLLAAAQALCSLNAQVTNGLIVHLPFDNNYNDTSGNGINGSAVGAPKFVPGKIGQAVSVTTLKDSSEIDYVTLGYPNLLKFGADVDFTISFWCNYTNQVDDPPFISNKDWNSSGNIGWGIFTQDGGNFRLNVTGDGGGAKESTSTTPVIRDGKWHNLLVSFARKGNLNIYVDGTLVQTNDLSQTTGSIDTDPSSFAVNIGQDGTGGYTDNGQAQMIGMMIDDLGIWRRILTPLEISQIYNNGIAGKSFDVNLAIAAPTIVSQPQNQTHFPGVNLTLSVKATGISDAYQWTLNGKNVAGATNSSLVLTNLQSQQAGTYSVIVSNPGGSITGQPFILSVVPLSTGSPVTNNLAAHLTFDGNYKDSSPNGVNGTAVGNPAFVPGIIGQAVSVTTLKDSSEIDYVTLGYPDVLKFGSNVDFTISFWCNYTNSIDDPPFISNKNWNSSGNLGWGIFTQGGGNFRVNVTGDGGGKESTTVTPIIRDGTWHNVVVRFTRTQSADIFVDGALYYSDLLSQVLGSIDTDPTSMVVNIGQDGTGMYTDGGSAEMVGVKIDDLGIWRRALNTQELEYIYLLGLTGKSFDVKVAASAAHFTSVSSAGLSLTINWEGGVGPFLLQRKVSLSATNWTSMLTTSNHSAIVANQGSTAFFRIVEQATNTVVPFTAWMTGAAEQPTAATSPGTGLAIISLDGNTLNWDVTYSGLTTNAIAAHIHGPSTTTNAVGIIVPFATPSGTSGRIIGSAVVTDTIRSNILAGRTYANIHTVNFPGGEIRGQVVPSNMRAILTGAAERPTPVTTTGSGTGTFTIIGNELTYNVTYANLSSAAVASHIHGPGTVDQAVGVIVPFTAPTGTSGAISGKATLTLQYLDYIVDGLTYANLHTVNFGGGEIRGQIGPAQ